MSGWQVFKHHEGERRFLLVGYGMRISGEVWRGAMKNDVFWGIKGLEHPQARQRVLNNWRVVRRRKIGGVSVEEAGRLVFLESPRSAQVVLRFSQTVPSELLVALREAFEGPPQPTRKEPDREESLPEAQLDPPLPPDGYRPGLDEDPAREAAQARHDPGVQGLEKVAAKPKKKGKTHGNAKGNRGNKRPSRR